MTEGQIQLSGHRAHDSGGEASGGGINATKCRNEFGCRPDVRIIACVSQQTDGRNNGHKGAHISGGLPTGEKLGPVWLGTGQGTSVFLSLYFSPSLSVLGYTNTLKSTSMGNSCCDIYDSNFLRWKIRPRNSDFRTCSFYITRLAHQCQGVFVYTHDIPGI